MTSQNNSILHIGCVLHQKHDIILHQIYYAPNILTKTQQKWPSFQRELYALKFYDQKFRHSMTENSLLEQITRLWSIGEPSTILKILVYNPLTIWLRCPVYFIIEKRKWRNLLVIYAFQEPTILSNFKPCQTFPNKWTRLHRLSWVLELLVQKA
jgi:hypothetical protein